MLLGFEQFVTASIINRVIHGCGVPRLQSAYALRELFGTVGEVLGKLRSDVKAEDKCLVIARSDGVVQKFDRGFLLKFETLAN